MPIAARASGAFLRGRNHKHSNGSDMHRAPILLAVPRFGLRLTGTGAGQFGCAQSSGLAQRQRVGGSAPLLASEQLCALNRRNANAPFFPSDHVACPL